MKDAKQFTNYKQTINRHNLIMLATAGSTVLGLSSNKDSDVDEVGIALETPEQLLGFAPFEHEVYRTAEDRTGRADAKSEPGDIDLTIYGLRKFIRLALGGNPNLMLMLYISANSCSVYTPTASQLQSLEGLFASKAVGEAFAGYLKSQRMRLKGVQGGMDVNRSELVSRFGYDTKYAMHALRLGMQGVEFMTTGRLQLPMSAQNVEYLTAVKNGVYTLKDVIAKIDKYQYMLSEELMRTGLPDKPNYQKVEAWLLDVYKKAWYENKTAPQQLGSAADQEGKNQTASEVYSEAFGSSLLDAGNEMPF